MERSSKTRIRNIFTLLGIIGLIIVLLINRHQFVNCWHLLKDLRWYIIAIVVIVQVASYWVNALYYRSILRIYSYDVGLVRLFEGALATNFVNYVAPTVGLAGAGYLSQVLSPEVPRGEGVLTQLMRYAFSALAVLLMMPVGFILIFLSSNSSHAIVRVTLLSSLAIIVLAICVVAFIQQETTLRKVLIWLERSLKRIFPKFRGQSMQHFINEFYVGYHTMARQKRRLLVPFAWSIVYILIALVTFYLAFLAFGKVVNPGIAIMAYLFANITSIFGGVFFSTGIFELGMAGTLVALGIPLALAVAVTTIYRVLNLLIGLPPGYYFYRQYLPK
jgi:uncharacterized protein (TIRG00374 family)